MNDTTFLAQLEQRTQQVKITLANLEAERTRIEGMIAQLQPLVPHYDALIAAERALAQAEITIPQLAAGAEAPEQPERHEPQPAEQHAWEEQAQPEHHAEEQPSW